MAIVETRNIKKYFGEIRAVDGVDLAVTVSVGGVTVTKAMQIADGDEISAAADKAMYEAKRRGRNQVRWAKL